MLMIASRPSTNVLPNCEPADQLTLQSAALKFEFQWTPFSSAKLCTESSEVIISNKSAKHEMEQI